MKRFTLLLGMTALLLTAAASVPAQDSPPEVPNLQELEQPGRLKDYTAAAGKFIHENAGAPEVPRVWGDLLLLHSIVKNTEAVKVSRQALLMDHPLSPYTAQAMRGFRTAKECREFLTAFHKEWVIGNPNQPALAQFALGSQYGLQHFEGDFLSDDDFALNCAAAAREVSLVYLQRRVHQKLATSNEEVQQIAAVILDDKATPAERFVQLQPFMKRTSVRQLQTLLWARTAPAQQQTPGLLSTRVESLLRNNNFKAAYPLLKALNESEDSEQMSLWTAWAAAASGNLSAATAGFDRVADSQSPNAAISARLAAALRNSDDAVENQTAAVLQISQTLLGIDPAIEVSGTFAPEEGAPLHFHVALNRSADFAEVLVRRATRTMALRIDAGEGRVLLPGENVIHVFESGATLPKPDFQFTVTPDGSMNFSFNTNFGDDVKNTDRDPLRALFKSPILSTEAGLQSLLGTRISRGTVPEFTINRETGDRILTWLSFDPDSSQPTVTELAVTANGQMKSLQLDQLNINQIRYGDHSKFKFEQPAWPDYPVHRHAELPPSMMFRLFSEFSTLLESGN